MTWLDSDNRYGLVSRAIHWLMAALLIFMLLSEVWMEAFEEIGGGSGMPLHQGIGLALGALLVLRLFWRLVNWGQIRPPERWRMAAKLGHIALYGLMLALPLTGLFSTLGSGHGLHPFGLTLIERGPEIEWMEEIGEDAHEVMANLLWFVLAGHVLAALLHHHVVGDNTLRKMA